MYMYMYVYVVYRCICVHVYMRICVHVGQFVGEVLFDQSRTRHKFIYIYCLEVLLPWDIWVIHVLPDLRAKSFSQIYVRPLVGQQLLVTNRGPNINLS